MSVTSCGLAKMVPPLGLTCGNGCFAGAIRSGGGLKSGDLVMSGALAKMIAAEPGSAFKADFGALGKVEVAFAP